MRRPRPFARKTLALFQACEQLQLRGKTIVAHPASNITLEPRDGDLLVGFIKRAGMLNAVVRGCSVTAAVRAAQCSRVESSHGLQTLKALDNIAQGRVAHPGLCVCENQWRGVRRLFAFARPSRNVTDVATSNVIRLMVCQLLVAFALIV